MKLVVGPDHLDIFLKMSGDNCSVATLVAGLPTTERKMFELNILHQAISSRIPHCKAANEKLGGATRLPLT